MWAKPCWRWLMCREARGDHDGAHSSAQRAFEVLSRALGADHRLSLEASGLR